MNREEFLKISALGIGATLVPGSLLSGSSDASLTADALMLGRLVKANDRTVKNLLAKGFSAKRRQAYRPFSIAFANLTASYLHPDSDYHNSQEVLTLMHQILDFLNAYQYPNGTLDSGGNRKSPPDTAFLLDYLCTSAFLFKAEDGEFNQAIKRKLDGILLAAGEGIRTGGVHTPNHRWEISSVLAKLYKLYGDENYVERIDQWLAEGIYQNEDGNYPERSRNYAIVENSAFITIGEYLNRPNFFEIVSKNLETTYFYMEPDGEMVCLDSRRQDQYNPISCYKTYLSYRYLANKTTNSFFAEVARSIEKLENFEEEILASVLPEFMASPILMKEMPKGGVIPEIYTRHLIASDLVRLRRGKLTASIFAGNDLPLTVASGRSCNPTFFTFRKGNAILEYVRLSTSFFNTGYVRGEGLIKNENQYILKERKEAYYYQPMPVDLMDKDGDYKLTESLDRRFWSKMDFGNRPKKTLALETTIKIEEVDSAFIVDIEISNTENVQVTLDLCFKEGGEIKGASEALKEGDFYLDDGWASYTYEDDKIEVGPGKYAHSNTNRLDGEVYSTHFGSIKGSGQHIYITGLTPFKHSLTIK